MPRWPAATARSLPILRAALALLVLLSTATAAVPLSRLNPHYRNLLQSDSTSSASHCACPQAAILSGSCASSQATLSFTSQGSTLVTCAPAPVYDQYSRTLTWSACIRSGCLPASFASQGYTASTSNAAIENADALAGPVTLRVALRTSSDVMLGRVVLTTPSGQQLPVASSAQSLSVPAEGLAFLSLTAQVPATKSSNSTSLLALALSDGALAGQPPARPLPPSPPPSPPPDPAADNVEPSVIGVIETAYLVGYALQPDAVPPFLDENTTVSVGWSYITVTAGYKDFSEIDGCSAAITEAVAQIVAGAGWTVPEVSCALNAPSGAQAACLSSSSLLLSVTVRVNGTDTEAAALQLRTFLTAPATDTQGLGASCTTAPLVSRALSVQQVVDPSAVPPGTGQLEACAADQASIQGTLAAALSLNNNQLLLLPAFCSAYQVQPPPIAPYPPPDAPELIRHPYTPWKSAVLGGVLGSVFVIQIVVLAVWVWYNRQEHRKAEAALALAYQTPQHKYGAVDGHA